MPDQAVSGKTTQTADPNGLPSALFACPDCCKPLKTLAPDNRVLDCLHCGTSFPVYGAGSAPVPWLLPEPDAALLEWKARLEGFLLQADASVEKTRDALRNVTKGTLTEKRLIARRDALSQHRDLVLRQLEPLPLTSMSFAEESDPARRLAHKLPANQGLTSYYDNLFRDWAWDNGENDTLLDIVRSLARAAKLKHIGRALTLGAGSCRLSYDVHRTLQPKQSVAVDFNPLLLLSAARILSGETVDLYEFPVAPRKLEQAAALQHLRAPEALDLARDDFVLVLADVCRLPFAAESADLVITPWLIDIITEDFNAFSRRVNAQLPVGGVWINTGSVAFADADPARQYSREEVLDLVESAGFEIVSASSETTPYLCSPLSAHGRQEEVFSFAARKLAPCDAPETHAVLPAWLRDTRLPVPTDAVRDVASSRHLLLAQVLGAADGQRSVAEIGALLAQHHGLSPEEATHVVRRIFAEQAEERALRPNSITP